MAIQTINTGTSPNKGDGDSIRTAFNKVNNNFNYLEEVISGSLDSGTFTSVNTRELYSSTSSLRIGRLGNIEIYTRESVFPTMLISEADTVIDNNLLVNKGTINLANSVQLSSDILGLTVDFLTNQWRFEPNNLVFPDGSIQSTAAFSSDQLDHIDGGVAVTVYSKQKLTNVTPLDSGGAITLYSEQGLNINGGLSDTQFDTLRVNGGEA